MGDTLFGKPYGLTHEDMIKAHHLFTATAKKTPYQLDLEVKDRKPDIVPKVGDKVKIKSREWYEKWKNVEGHVWIHNAFVNPMTEFCSMILTIEDVDGMFFSLKGNTWRWTIEMFEEVYPQESSKEVKCAKAFEALKTSTRALEDTLKATSAIPAINPVQGIGIATDWSKLVSDTVARITLPQQNLFCSPGFYCQSLLEKEEPELQTIKKHRFIKLEKL